VEQRKLRRLSRFRDRTEAGALLAEQLGRYRNRSDTVVLALPRGGVPVGYEIATALNLPLDILVVRKLGLPNHSELAMGAIAGNDTRVLNHELIRWLNIPDQIIEAVAAREAVELKRREQAYRASAPPMEVAGKTSILVDDGIATGSSIRAAVQVTRLQQPAEIVIVVPTAPASSIEELEREADDVVVYMAPEDFVGVGQWYDDFSQVSDETVCDLYQRAQRKLRI
jgi:putative phosphoribosyl transferase